MAAPRPASEESPDADWTDQVADLIVDVVDRIHDATTARLVTVARWIVYGTVAAIVSIAIGFLGIILIGRLLEMIPLDIWIPYTAIGGVLVLVGLFCWGKREATSS